MKPTAPVVFLLLALVGLACDESSSRPEAPDHGDGGPPFGKTLDPEVAAAKEALGSSYEIVVQARRAGRTGCGLLRVSSLEFAAQTQGTVSVAGLGVWASFPERFLEPDDRQVPAGVAYRAGGRPIAWFTADYPEHAYATLSYRAEGSYRTAEGTLALILESVVAGSGDGPAPKGMFVAAVYEGVEGEAKDCAADPLFEGEFFIAVDAAPVEMGLEAPDDDVTLCEPCQGDVATVSLKLHRPAARR